MNPANLPVVDVNAIVLAEFEAMTKRCEAAGVPRDVSRKTLANMLILESLKAVCDSERIREAAAAETPARKALQKAWDFGNGDGTFNPLGASRHASEFDSICAEYLLLAHGAVLGDTLEIHGWAKPRTIRISSFRLSFSHADEPTEAFMWFDGEPVRNCPSKRATSEHGCSLDSWVRKV